MIKFHNDLDLSVKQAFEYIQKIDPSRAPVCQRGCTVCCENVYFEIFLDEMPVFISALNKLPFKLKKQIAKNIAAITEMYILNGGRTNPVIDKEACDSKAVEAFRLKYRCPLLVSGGCVIYPDRPAACRTYFSTNKSLCENWNADMNVSNVIDDHIKHFIDLQSGLTILPMHPFLNIEFIGNKFVIARNTARLLENVVEKPKARKD